MQAASFGSISLYTFTRSKDNNSLRPTHDSKAIVHGDSLTCYCRHTQSPAPRALSLHVKVR